jgi:hypothetical protein
MQIRKKTTLLLFVVLAITIMTAMSVLHGRTQNSPAFPKQEKVPSEPTAKELDDAATPIVDFDNPNGAELAVELGGKHSRKLKNARYDKYDVVQSQPHPQAGETRIDSEWQVGLSDLPADKSDAVVEGQVTDAKAFLSNDKTGVYSEFTIHVSRVLKVAPDLSVNLDDTIVAERFGGRVRYPSGKVIRHRIEGQGSPLQGKKYLFFLAKADEGNYKLLTAYEIQGQKVFALDGSRINFRGQGDWRFDKHNGEDLEKFMQKVQNAIADSQGGRGQP